MNRRHCTVLVLLLILLSTQAPAQAQSPRLVLAFYYAWYDEQTWTPDKVPDMPATPYRSADRATIERQVREASQAGIDALVLSWLGPGNPTEDNFRALLEVAQAQGLHATVDVECSSSFMPDWAALSAGMAHLVQVHAKHPAFARFGADQAPVVFFWRQQRYSLAQWAALRDQVDPRRAMLWIAEGDDPAWLEVFDGLHLYNVTWRENTNPEYTASKMRARVDAYNAAHGTHKLWVATAMPGYDDTHIAGRTQSYTWPRSPEYYQRTWHAAIESAPEMVVINSYNEWPEGTMIEPSVSYGRTYLALTAQMAALYKERGTPDHQATVSPTAAPTAAQSSAATATAMPTPTPTHTAMPTATAVSTATHTPSPTWTASPTATATNTPTGTPTAMPTATATGTRTRTPTATATGTRTRTPTATATSTTAPTSTATPRSTRTFSPTSAYNKDGTPTPAVPAAQPADRVPPCCSSVVQILGLVGVGWVLEKRNRVFQGKKPGF